MICPIISSGKEIVKCKENECMAYIPPCKRWIEESDCPENCIGEDDMRFCRGYCSLIEKFPSESKLAMDRYHINITMISKN